VPAAPPHKHPLPPPRASPLQQHQQLLPLLLQRLSLHTPSESTPTAPAQQQQHQQQQQQQQQVAPSKQVLGLLLLLSQEQKRMTAPN
jgi:hypothetical protein